MNYRLLYLLQGLWISSACVAHSATYTVTASTNVATIRTALSSCSAGDTLIVSSGDYGEQQYIGNFQPDGKVTIRFPDQDWFEAVLQLVDCKNVTIENLWMKPQESSAGNPQPAIRIRGSSSENIVIQNSRIDGQNAKYGIQITGDTDLPVNWPTGITIENCEIFSSYNNDLINVNGANHIIIRDCHLHDPIIPAGTSEHIDAIQVIRARSIYILNNWITFALSSSGYVRNEGLNPFQGVILSTTGTQTISHFEVRGNYFAEWVPGTPIIVSGTNVSDDVVYGNTLIDCVDDIVFGVVGDGISSFANAVESSPE